MVDLAYETHEKWPKSGLKNEKGTAKFSRKPDFPKKGRQDGRGRFHKNYCIYLLLS